METAVDIRDYVYKHLEQLYTKFAMDTFEYITPEIAQIISYTAYAEMIQMVQCGYIRSYYERLIKGAV